MGPSAECGHAGYHGRWHGQGFGARALHTETQTPGSARPHPHTHLLSRLEGSKSQAEARMEGLGKGLFPHSYGLFPSPAPLVLRPLSTRQPGSSS